jgi:hypothetical protein
VEDLARKAVYEPQQSWRPRRRNGAGAWRQLGASFEAPFYLPDRLGIRLSSGGKI